MTCVKAKKEKQKKTKVRSLSQTTPRRCPDDNDAHDDTPFTMYVDNVVAPPARLAQYRGCRDLLKETWFG